MLEARFSVFRLTAYALGSALAVWACTTETIVNSAPPAGDDAGGVPEGDGGEPADPADAGPPPDRSVKGTWEKITVHPADGDPIEKLASIVVRGPSDVYVSEGASNLGTGFYHYDGKAWTGVRYSGLASSLVKLPSGDVFGIGTYVYVKAKKGVEWELFPQPDDRGSPASVWSLWGASATDFFASTGVGHARFNGSSYAPVTGIDTHQGVFTGTSGKDVWFSTYGSTWGQLAHFDGTSWTNHWDKLPPEVKKLPAAGPYGVFATGADNVWAMGGRRTVIHYDGATWSVVPGPNDEWGCDLTRFWSSSKKNAWLVGKGGCVFHWDGAAWEKIPSGVTDDIFGIDGSDAEHVWIAPYSTTTVLRLKPL